MSQRDLTKVKVYCSWSGDAAGCLYFSLSESIHVYIVKDAVVSLYYNMAKLRKKIVRPETFCKMIYYIRIESL